MGLDFLLSHHVLFAFSQEKFYFSYAGGKVFNDAPGENLKRLVPKAVLTPAAATQGAAK